MTRVFHVASDLGPTAVGKTLSMVLPSLAERGVRQFVGNLGDELPFGPILSNSRIDVQHYRMSNVFDIRNKGRLRKAIDEYQPDIVHFWGTSPRSILCFGFLPAFLRGGRGSGLNSTPWRTLVTSNNSSSIHPPCPTLAWGVAWQNRTAVIVPSSVVPSSTHCDRNTVRTSLGVSINARLIVAAGRFDGSDAMKLAAWAFDVLKYTDRNLHMMLLGDGPQRRHLEQIVQRTAYDDNRIHFAGVRADVPAILAVADLAWLTHPRGGVHFALECLAAGLPIIAMRNPDLANVLVDPSTAMIVESGDRIQMASATAQLLKAPDRIAELSAAGRNRAACFPENAAVEAILAAYPNSQAPLPFHP